MAGSGYNCGICGTEMLFGSQPKPVWHEKCGDYLWCRVEDCRIASGPCYYPPREATVFCPQNCQPAQQVRYGCGRTHVKWVCHAHTEEFHPILGVPPCKHCGTAMDVVEPIRPLWRQRCGAPIFCRVPGCPNTSGPCYYPPRTGYVACPKGCADPAPFAGRLMSCDESHAEWLCEEHTTTVSTTGQA
ncbi:hypothetical protein O181_022658 [Austropuccinia psidii MF-1]|uniref:Uncharacterized protein n=1 Tax=Austropuccinia psidii MF-1 TaxID=1389203 RepID=A0A9Q3CFL3_9BASI|nr:hypothetical protein [Austropuccinia psidii MF-1]